MLAYKFRLYPKKEQERKLLRTTNLCRQVYNQLLGKYNDGMKNWNDLGKYLTQLKQTWPELNEVYAKCLQMERDRLFANLAALKQMKKRGRKVGKLRFKAEHRFKTFTYNQSGFKLLPKNDKFGFLHLSKIGDIPLRLHRKVEGEIKGVIIKHMSSGKWYAYLLVDNGGGTDELTVIDTAVGIDVGLEHYAVDSDGNEVENQRYLRNALKRLRREQRRLSKKQKESKNRERQRIRVARQYEKVCNQRHDFQHKLSRQYVDNYDLIVTEKLKPRDMDKNRRMAKSISDASWSSLSQKIAYKAENAGWLFVQVDPRGTSQECSRCGKLVPKSLEDRWHDCVHCGLHLSRDHNASINILKRGLEKVRSERPELTLADIRPLQKPASLLQVGWMKQEALLERAG